MAPGTIGNDEEWPPAPIHQEGHVTSNRSRGQLTAIQRLFLLGLALLATSLLLIAYPHHNPVTPAEALRFSLSQALGTFGGCVLVVASCLAAAKAFSLTAMEWTAKSGSALLCAHSLSVMVAQWAGNGQSSMLGAFALDIATISKYAIAIVCPCVALVEWLVYRRRQQREE